MDRDEMQFLGTGLYSEREAARLTGVRVQRVRRWVRGYEFTTPGGERRTSPPVLERGLGEVGTPLMGFTALVDIRVVRAFRDAGVSWPALREAARVARERFGVEHPFSDRRFKTDGKNVFLSLKHGRRDPALIDILEDQFVFSKIVEPFLLNLDFSGNEPCRWFPLGKKRHVLLDPERSFGQPITREGSVSTSIIAAAVAVEKSASRVARWYGIPLSAVKDAVQYEAQLAA